MKKTYYETVHSCRVCKGHITKLFDLGEQELTGRFPSTINEDIPKGPVTLTICKEGCGLVQLQESYNLGEMYGANYGYRSGLNASMVKHLKEKIEGLKKLVKLNAGDIVIDIGSNDGTTLSFYDKKLIKFGIDPTARKFAKFYEDDVNIIPNFFTYNVIRSELEGRKAKVITSFSMLYDLPDPIGFASDIYKTLEDDGIWVFEQSYLPLMLMTNSFDTICQEHLEYYTLGVIEFILDKAGLKVVDVELNDINGGSFSVVAVKKSNYSIAINENNIRNLKYLELKNKLRDPNTYRNFLEKIEVQKSELIKYLEKKKSSGEVVYGLGASTKGNVLLQYYGITSDLIKKIAEVNPDKYGRYTPGTHIEIVSEDEAIDEGVTEFLILPWHFRENFLTNTKFKGKKLIFPLPYVQVVEV